MIVLTYAASVLAYFIIGIIVTMIGVAVSERRSKVREPGNGMGIIEEARTTDPDLLVVLSALWPLIILCTAIVFLGELWCWLKQRNKLSPLKAMHVLGAFIQRRGIALATKWSAP